MRNKILVCLAAASAMVLVSCRPDCSNDNGGCDSNAVCAVASGGSLTCTCKAGYVGDGSTCTGNFSISGTVTLGVSGNHRRSASSTLSVTSGAVNEDFQLTTGPLNPDFVEARKEGFRKMTAEGSHGLGHVPSAVAMKFKYPAREKAVTYPSSFDLRNVGKVTPVKNQGSYGACWAFATMGSMESSLMPLDPMPDFSENNLVNQDGFDRGFGEGGNSNMSAAYLTRWAGPVSEIDDPYPHPDASPASSTVQKHLQNMVFFGDRSDSTDNEAIKEILTAHGAAYISFYYSDAYFDATHSSYYGGTKVRVNHAVTLVGWDDNYPAANFKTRPAGNGAFLIKNSWGESWGDHGYFWISYHDQTFGGVTSFYGTEDADNYDGIYQHDPLGWIKNVGYQTREAFGANVFTAKADETLKAVGFYTVVPSATYSVKIYTNVTDGQPTSGVLAQGTATGSKAMPGFYTVTLDSPVQMTAGTRFSVVIDMKSPAPGYQMAYEYAVTDWSSAATAAPGQSFMSSNGTAWTDLTTMESSANLCIKAYVGKDSGLSGAQVTDGTRSVLSDGEGKFSITGVPDGTHVVTPTLDGYVFTPISRSVTVSGQTVSGADFTATPIR